jgi:hypothetical protein
MKKILVIACGLWDYGTLQRKMFTDEFEFYFEEITTQPCDIDKFIKYIVNKYQAKNLDGVLGTHDGPENLIAAIIARQLKLPGVDPASAFVCEHKYYSRMAQKKTVPKAVPDFQYLPVEGLEKEDVTLPYPFFVKPVKSAFSMLARSIDSFETLDAFLPKVRERFAITLPAFNYLFNEYTNFELDAGFLIAEQVLEGDQVTVEGYSWRKNVSIMGITDSIMYPGTMSFKRFEYPSKLPPDVQERMADIAKKVIEGIGLDYTVFDIEMFYNRQTDAVHIIEINPRMSYQFADIFEKVDGMNTYAMQLDLAQGKKPAYKKGSGQFGVAASFVLRVFEDKQVVRVPTEDEVKRAHEKFPDAFIIIKVDEGTKLSDVSQDETSYRYAIINLGGKDWPDLYARFEQLSRYLRFEFKPVSCDIEKPLVAV